VAAAARSGTARKRAVTPLPFATLCRLNPRREPGSGGSSGSPDIGSHSDDGIPERTVSHLRRRPDRGRRAFAAYGLAALWSERTERASGIPARCAAAGLLGDVLRIWRVRRRAHAVRRGPPARPRRTAAAELSSGPWTPSICFSC